MPLRTPDALWTIHGLRPSLQPSPCLASTDHSSVGTQAPDSALVHSGLFAFSQSLPLLRLRALCLYHPLPPLGLRLLCLRPLLLLLGYGPLALVLASWAMGFLALFILTPFRLQAPGLSCLLFQAVVLLPGLWAPGSCTLCAELLGPVYSCPM